MVNFSDSSLIEAADDSGFAPSALGSVHDPVADLVGLPVEGIKQCVRKLRPLSNEPLDDRQAIVSTARHCDSQPKRQLGGRWLGKRAVAREGDLGGR